MNPPPLPASSPAEQLRQRLPAPLSAALLGLALTWCADFLLWPAPLGLSLGILAALLAGFSLVARGFARPTRSTWIALALLVPSCVQAGVEMSFSNLLVVGLILLWIMGESFFPAHRRGWLRMAEAVFALLRAPGRWLWLGGALSAATTRNADSVHSHTARISRLIRIVAPALALAVIFSLIFCSGNAVFREGMSRVFYAVCDWIVTWDISLLRVFFWLVAATLALAWVRPSSLLVFSGDAPAVPRWQRSDPSVARWQSILVLAALNLLFCVVNTIDAVYLWFSRHFPAGETYTAYVHEGVNSLIVAVVLSAIVMVVIFQQDAEVSDRPGLKFLAHLWTIQNIALIASVFLRLKIYVDASQLTPRRVYVACFLTLVFAGFIYLTIYVQRRRDFGWLFFRNLHNTFLLFFLLQFADVAGWVANWNVDQSRLVPGRVPDIYYLASLGADAAPALSRVAAAKGSSDLSATAAEAVRKLLDVEQPKMEHEDWRSIQWRRDHNIAEAIRAEQQRNKPAK